jgi:hypothetical protein
VATQTVGRELGIGLFYDTPADLAASLRDRPAMERLYANVATHRAAFTFDDHADRLIAFLRRAIDRRPAAASRSISLPSWKPARRSRSERPA